MAHCAWRHVDPDTKVIDEQNRCLRSASDVWRLRSCWHRVLSEFFQMDGRIVTQLLCEMWRSTLARIGQNNRHHWYAFVGNQHQVWAHRHLWRNPPNSHQRARVARQNFCPQTCGHARRHGVVRRHRGSCVLHQAP